MPGEVSASSIIHDVLPNLDIIPSGGVFSNTLALLESSAMKALIKEIKKHYDFIILDAPDLDGKADAGVMGKLSDGVVFVVRTGVADIKSVSKAKEFLKNSRQNVLGMVVNEAKVRNVNPKNKLLAGFAQQKQFELQGESSPEFQSESSDRTSNESTKV